MNTTFSPIPLLARGLLGLIFILAGIKKISAVAATASLIASHGLPFATILAYGAIIVELGGGLFLVAGLYARGAALILFFYTLALAIIFHPYWTVAPTARPIQHAFFYEHLSMMGGMLYVVIFGAGSLSIDRFMRRN